MIDWFKDSLLAVLLYCPVIQNSRKGRSKYLTRVHISEVWVCRTEKFKHSIKKCGQSLVKKGSNPPWVVFLRYPTLMQISIIQGDKETKSAEIHGRPLRGRGRKIKQLKMAFTCEKSGGCHWPALRGLVRGSLPSFRQKRLLLSPRALDNAPRRNKLNESPLVIAAHRLPVSHAMHSTKHLRAESGARDSRTPNAGRRWLTQKAQQFASNQRERMEGARVSCGRRRRVQHQITNSIEMKSLFP
jgi:hypothetical protein